MHPNFRWDFDYRPARSWFDLSALIMWAKRDGALYMQHHAILVVGDTADTRLYHWSYRHRTFEPGVLNGRVEGSGPVLTCLPGRDFATKWLVFFPESSESDYVRYSAHDTYRIPNPGRQNGTAGRAQPCCSQRVLLTFSRSIGAGAI